MQKFPSSTDSVRPFAAPADEPASFSPTPALVPEPTVLPPALPCANCETPLAGPYCHHCGQHRTDYHRSIWRFLGDFFDNTLCWDNKYLLTVQPLLRRPGFLTREFMAGRRVRYVHPLRLFLFTSAVCLTLIGFLHHQTERPARRPKAKTANFSGDLGGRKRAKAKAVSADPASSSLASTGGDPSAAPDSSPTPESETLAQKIQGVLAASAAQRPGAAPTAAATPSPGPATVPFSSPVKTGDAAADERVSERLAQANEKVAAAEELRAKKFGQMVEAGLGSEEMGKVAEKITEGIQQRLSWVALALLPVFALFVRALYWRKDSYYFEHLVFSLHYHTFLFLFWTAYVVLDLLLALLPGAGLWNALLLCGLLLPGWYLYAALRRMYGESPRRTVAKVLVVGSLHVLAVIIGVSAVGTLAYLSARG